jgi:hypothetical protein
VIAMPNTTDRFSARVRRADDAVLTEMARSLLRDAGPVAGVASTEPRAAELECARSAGRRFTRSAGTARFRPVPLAARRA